MAGALAGRVVLVTGSSRGIGAEVVAKAAAEGAMVAVHYHQASDRAEAVVERARACGVEAERFDADIAVGQEAEQLVERVIARFGRLDGLVNNAGRTLVGPFLETEPQVWDEVIRTDLTAAFHTCRAALPSMVERGSGSIVNMASRLGQIGVPDTAAYSAAKAGLIGLTRALAREFGPRGIRVNAVSPGFVHTPLTELVTMADGVLEDYIENTPLGRVGVPEDVAGAVLFLCSDQASWLTGEVLDLNGGAHLKRYPDVLAHVDRMASA